MDKTITVKRDTYRKQNGRIKFSIFFMPPNVVAVKEVRRTSSNRRVNEYWYKMTTNILRLRANCDSVTCKVWVSDDAKEKRDKRMDKYKSKDNR